MQRAKFDAIGTHWQIDADQLPASIKKRIAVFDKNYSRFRADSLVTQIYKRPGKYKLPSDAKPMLDLYQKLYKLTDGIMTPLIGKLISDAGYDAKYSLSPTPLSAPPAWNAINYKYPFITTRQPILFDFGAAGKGYLIDLVGEILKDNFVIDAGGDILHKGSDSLRVGLEHPENKRQVIGVATIKNQSICGSAGNRRKWGKFHHILNPHTLKPQNSILATWVVAKTALLADALATALYFVEPEKLLPHFAFDYLVLYPDYTIQRSEAFYETY